MVKSHGNPVKSRVNINGLMPPRQQPSDVTWWTCYWKIRECPRCCFWLRGPEFGHVFPKTKLKWDTRVCMILGTIHGNMHGTLSSACDWWFIFCWFLLPTWDDHLNISELNGGWNGNIIENDGENFRCRVWLLGGPDSECATSFSLGASQWVNRIARVDYGYARYCCLLTITIQCIYHTSRITHLIT